MFLQVLMLTDHLTVDDTPAFRRYCAFQLYDMPDATQADFIHKLRVFAEGHQLAARVQAAVAVNLPGVAESVPKMLSMQGAIRNAADLILFRFYAGSNAALIPRRAHDLGYDAPFLEKMVAADPHLRPYRKEGFDEQTRRWPGTGKQNKGHRILASRFFPDMARRLEVTVGDFAHGDQLYKEEVSLFEGAPQTADAAEMLLAYLHQTGRRKGSPFLSCTAVMPKMVRSASKVLRSDVMPKAPYLGVFLVPRAHRYILWPHPNQSHESAVHTLEEAEVLYKFPPPMEVFQLFRIANPWANGTALPGKQPMPGTKTLHETKDPGYAEDDMPGLLDVATMNAAS